jgi:NADH:ubiquinone oxidoreductase subunit K
MNNLNLVRGLFLMGIALIFGLSSLQYSIGRLSNAGAGLFPLIVSSFLFVIGLVTVIRARYVERVPLDFKYKNIAIILGSLCGFALISKFANVTAGVVFMVFFSSLAATTRSVSRSLKVVAGLLLIAYAFHKLLGLNLPLI